jgi:hypothetical protein
MSLGQVIFVFSFPFWLECEVVCHWTNDSIVKATLQNVKLPQERGQAFALLNRGWVLCGVLILGLFLDY